MALTKEELGLTQEQFDFYSQDPKIRRTEYATDPAGFKMKLSLLQIPTSNQFLTPDGLKLGLTQEQLDFYSLDPQVRMAEYNKDPIAFKMKLSDLHISTSKQFLTLDGLKIEKSLDEVQDKLKASARKLFEDGHSDAAFHAANYNSKLSTLRNQFTAGTIDAIQFKNSCSDLTQKAQDDAKSKKYGISDAIWDGMRSLLKTITGKDQLRPSAAYEQKMISKHVEDAVKSYSSVISNP